jgi:hypothetical protein
MSSSRGNPATSNPFKPLYFDQKLIGADRLGTIGLPRDELASEVAVPQNARICSDQQFLPQKMA